MFLSLEIFQVKVHIFKFIKYLKIMFKHRNLFLLYMVSEKFVMSLRIIYVVAILVT